MIVNLEFGLILCFEFHILQILKLNLFLATKLQILNQLDIIMLLYSNSYLVINRTVDLTGQFLASTKKSAPFLYLNLSLIAISIFMSLIL